MKKNLFYITLYLPLSKYFVFIPGNVIHDVSDAITGSEGNHCVGTNAKMNNRITLPGGGKTTVKSLSGTSISCTQPEYPVRALLVFDGPATPTGADRQ